MSNEYNKTTDEIREELLGYLPNLYEKTVGTAIWDFCQSVALGFKKLLDSINTVLGMHDVHNMTGDDLTKACKQRRNIIRKLKKASSGYLTLTGDFSVAIGDLFESGGGVVFVAKEAVSSTTTAQVLVECQSAGSVGNVAAGSITKSVGTISGVISINNDTAFANGYDDESDASLTARYDEDLALPLTSGNKHFYLKWAKEVVGVGKARVFPLRDGDNTVKVVIVDANFKPADDTLVASAQAYIDPNASGRGEGQAPMGAYCTVVSASGLNLSITVSVELEAGADEATVSSNAMAKINEYLQSIAFEKDYVSYAQIGSCILAADGVKDYSGLTLNGDTVNVAVSDEQVAVLYALNLTV